MVSIDLDAVLLDLNRRFAVPLLEFYDRRIIFWYDEDREFEDKLDDLRLENATLVKLTGSNTFAVKKLLCEDDRTSNFLVYQPLSFDKPDDNWLVNVQLYSEEFRADLNSIWMEEMGLPSTPAIRQQVKGYRKFFGAKFRRDAVGKLNLHISTALDLHLAVMAAICGCQDAQPGSIIRAVLNAGLDMEQNQLYRNLENYGARNAFWAVVGRVAGYSEGEDSSLRQLAVHLLLTAATRTMRYEYFAGLESFLSSPHQAFCYDFISDWLRSGENRQLYEIAHYVEETARLPQRFAKLDVLELCDTDCFPCIDACILTALMTQISNQVIPVDTIYKVVEKRRTKTWYEDAACYYEGILQVANMQTFFVEHSGGFHIAEPYKLWQAYVADYYRMDGYYRQFHLCFQRSLKVSDPQLDDLFKRVAQRVEGLYAHWFLGQLGENWTKVCAEELEQYGRIQNIQQQTDFYRNYVRSSDNRVFVIVSDALRYEVAAALSEQLQREMQSSVRLSSCEAIFPTITKFGMAALLPHKHLEITEKGSGVLGIAADGVPTDAAYRDKILKSANNNSVALKYANIIGLKRAERQALVKGIDVVYIYHDRIDEASHTSDTAVFSACEDAIAEIKNLVRIIVNEFGGTKVFITADHGFLYTYNPLSEDDKLDKTGFADRIVELGRRYAILRQGAEPEYLLPVKFAGGHTGYEAFAPRENVRIKINGGGLNYVHGGISLQEMVVPVIEYQHLRSSTKAYQRNKDQIDTKPVALHLLSANRKICNLIFSLNFFQTEPVGGNREAATYSMYFVDAGDNQISDVCRVIADKTSLDGQERTFRCSFNLRSQKYSKLDSYYLVIADESGVQPLVKEVFQIDIAFAFEEFDFFG